MLGFALICLIMENEDEIFRKIFALIDRTTKVESQIAQLEKENITLKTQVSNLSARVERLKNK